ncbi:MAG: formate dehydrogenase accessory sulfurtransferase FdhD [Verrucomicrobiales bacterium]|nr:formate dehydrogenase accessory sulfurtransferase FdhD [Verrucomicrobiales bacterium]
MTRPSQSVELDVLRHSDGEKFTRPDHVAREEPLEIRVEGNPVAVAMRTPGHDTELAAGFLLTEGVIQDASDIFELNQCPTQAGNAETPGAVDVLLKNSEKLDLARLTRHVFTSSSCGLCGKTTIDSVFQSFPPVPSTPTLSPDLILALPEKLAAAQPTFDKTGGLHACGLFSLQGDLLISREDVGRHNALDKLLGHALLKNWLPLENHLVFLSGRVSFEMMQKTLAARVPAVAAISAPTSLAVDFACRSKQFLAAFIRGNSYNTYSHGR